MNEITIMQRRNLGNYEHREVTLSMSLAEGDDMQAAYTSLNESIAVALGYRDEQKVEKAVEPEAKPEPAPKKPAKKAAKKATTKKKAPEKKEPVVQVSKEEILQLCRDTANRLGSADKIKELIKTACGVDSLNDADPSTYNKLVELLKEA